MSYLMKNVLAAEPKAWKLFEDGINKLITEYPENDYYLPRVKKYPDCCIAVWDYENRLNMAEEHGVFRSIFNELEGKDEGYGYRLFVIGEDNRTEIYWNDRGKDYLDDITAGTDVTLPEDSETEPWLVLYANNVSTDIKATVKSEKRLAYLEMCAQINRLMNTKGVGTENDITSDGASIRYSDSNELHYWKIRPLATHHTDAEIAEVLNNHPQGDKIYILYGYWDTGRADGSKIIKVAYEPEPVIELLNKIADSKAGDYIGLYGHLQEDRGERHYKVVNVSGKYANFYIAEEVADYEK